MGSVFKWAVLDRLRGVRKPDARPFDTPRVNNDGAALRGNKDTALLTWIGHASWLVQLAGRNLLIDPIWGGIGGWVSRRAEPGVRIEDLPRIDAVLITHNHRDHMDLPTLAHFKTAEAIVPLGVGAAMRKVGYKDVTELSWWASHPLGPLTIHFVPSQHWSRRGIADANDSMWGGYVITGEGKRIYHSGDTAYFDGFTEIGERLGPIDVALLPIGAYDPQWFMRKQHMNPEDAVQAFRDMKAKRMLAMHWGTFQLTDEWLGEPPLRLRNALLNASDERRVEVLKIGETVSV
jgi:L-ascorbate metabolism protein UlaG (beta-lactamase superfamily)